MTYDDYIKNTKPARPYALMDLDDTLFQTKRKLRLNHPTANPDELPLVIVSQDKHGKPLSFFTQKQASFFHWLSTHTTLIPVTARDRTEIKRVCLPFDDWQVLTHGAVIVGSDGTVLPAWEQIMFTKLTNVQTHLQQLLSTLDDKKEFTITPHADTFKGEALTIYIAIKHTSRDHHALSCLARDLGQMSELAEHFYIHINANNLAILPHSVHKRHAVRFLLDNHLDKERVCFGFGDSLADLPFLRLLDWYGTPNTGQLHQTIQSTIHKSIYP